LLPLALLAAVLLAGCPDEETPALAGTADISALEGSGTIEYQWRRVGASGSPYGAIADAASPTYTVAHADVGSISG
jgi:hypothetical protein